MRTVGSLEASRLQPHGKPPWWFFHDLLGNIRFLIIFVRVTSFVNKTEHGQPVLLLSFNRVNLLY